jgi:hypothetical protein
MIESIGDFFQGIAESIAALPEAFVRSLAEFNLDRAGRFLESNLWQIAALLILVAVIFYRNTNKD